MENNFGITQLKLSNYRNHKFLQINPKKNIILITGRNGSGKTNVLESISLFDSTTGFRNSKLSELVRYDLKKMGDVISRDKITESDEPGFWRYSFMLPVEKKENRISLGEVVTPLIKLDKILKNLSFYSTVLIKDEGLLPTSSFKARGLAMAVSMAKQLNLNHLAIPTNGNAGAALAAYATKAGMKSTVF